MADGVDKRPSARLQWLLALLVMVLAHDAVDRSLGPFARDRWRRVTIAVGWRAGVDVEAFPSFADVIDHVLRLLDSELMTDRESETA